MSEGSPWEETKDKGKQGSRLSGSHLSSQHFGKLRWEAPLVTPEDAIKTLEVLAAVKQAADGGGLVRL